MLDSRNDAKESALFSKIVLGVIVIVAVVVAEIGGLGDKWFRANSECERRLLLLLGLFWQ